MPLANRIYFNGVFGALGGLVGWMLFGVFGAKDVPDSAVTFQLLLGGACIGGSIGYLLVSADAIRDRSLPRFVRLAAYGVVLGMLGGALGLWVGDLVNSWLVTRLGASRQGGFFHLVGTTIARGLGWTLLGIAIGLSEGVAARSIGKLSYGTLGGALGGFVGGALFSLVYQGVAGRGEAAALAGALGMVILGASIGSLSALVQAVLQPASLRVLRGWQEGREYPLHKNDTLLGRDERADIALFRDMRVEKQHAVIRRKGDGYEFVTQQGRPDATRINDEPVNGPRLLRDGDRLQLGNIVLRFQRRQGQGPGARGQGSGKKRPEEEKPPPSRTVAGVSGPPPLPPRRP